MKPQLSELIQIEAPIGPSLESVIEGQCVPPFSDSTLIFANLFSTYLLRDAEAKSRAELVALAFWMRKRNTTQLRDDFLARSQHSTLPRGLVFHIAPSNVDTVFIYSLFLSIFCGNRNIVRLSSTLNPQIATILRVLNECLSECPAISERVLIVRYEHNDEITAYYSQLCDMRVVWGGDETINRVRRFPLAPHAKELTFSDRFSLALIESKSYLDYEEKDQLISSFCNDSFMFNQMACSSPRLVCWVSSDPELTEKAQLDFWKRVQVHVEKHQPDISSAGLMDKYLSQCIYAVEVDGVVVKPTETQYVSRVQLPSAAHLERNLHKGNGLFLELQLGGLRELTSVLHKKDQTLSVFGFSEKTLSEFIETTLPLGVDRIVPFGEALSFSSVWDGYDLLAELTRIVTLKV